MLGTRRTYQSLMGAEASREIERIMGRAVIGFMSANHVTPDMAAEIFVLEPQLEEEAGAVSATG